MSEFNIGDRVKSREHKRMAVVMDKLYSNLHDDWMYTVKFDGSSVASTRPMTAEELEPIEPKTYRWEVFQAGENVMVAVMYEIDGDTETEVARQHCHIMHDGLIGIAQAASYAMKKIYIGMNDGKYIGSEDDGYVR